MAPLQQMSLDMLDAPAEQRRATLSNHELFDTTHLKPDMTWEQNYKPGTECERVGRHGSFTTGRPMYARPKGCEPLNRPPPPPRRGGLQSPGRVWLGGAPSALERSERQLSAGTVLNTVPHLSPALSHETYYKPGTVGERQGKRGSFTGGANKQFLAASPAWVRSELSAVPESRRHAGHLPRGAILKGGPVRR